MKGEKLLLKYINEGLSNEERFELEKVALTDDFIADAWEGLSSGEVKDSKAVLARLTSRIKSNRTTKIVPLYRKVWPYAVAASLALVFTFAFLLRQPGTDQMDSLALEASSGNENLVATEIPEEVIIDKTSIPESVEAGQAPGNEMSIEESTASDFSASSRSKAESEPIAIPTEHPTSDDNISNALTAEKLGALPRNDVPVEIPKDIPNLAATEDIVVITREEEEQEKAKSAIRPDNTGIRKLDIPADDLAIKEEPKKVRVKVQKSAVAVDDDTKKEVVTNQRVSKLKLEPNAAVLNEAADVSNFNAQARLVEETQGFDSELTIDTLPIFEKDLDKIRQALEDEKDPIAQAKYHFQLASVLFRRDNKLNEAKEEALKAAQLNPGWGQPYVLLGDMYSKDAKNCGDSWNQSLAILAAYDSWLFAKTKKLNPSIASNVNQKLARYREHFPKPEDGFMRGIKQGDEARVGCWIDEVVVVRFR